ncbi:MAG TPA: DUF4386 domain-containing protein [Spirochaetota bacterium]|nr:DUF4386 domain-containing protein [Spirochaetota bacterium]HOS32300.1 DUF4386 domain-containing protein [Spirochaetota bacterium]HOS54686.1 DUF4386 domain-containing protein [Spirochaetota bacterium]HQF77294.1 DUF4386 domain-containing protein [Spirochaetota bacterium]HQH29370.1 DUF4386 domain-containing protein [Spirochaetota bacterium]
MNKKNSAVIFYARLIGAFFLLAFVAYGFGSQLFASEDNPTKILGALLIVTNSLMVLSIGILLGKTLKQYNPLVANIYLFTRIFEAVALSSVIVVMFLKGNVSKDLGYIFGMLVLGIGSIPMCLTLYKHKIAPSWLALWGAIGYAIFAFGMLMELFGYEWSMYLLGPGGLWEVTFAIWLLIRGSKNVKPEIG